MYPIHAKGAAAHPVRLAIVASLMLALAGCGGGGGSPGTVGGTPPPGTPSPTNPTPPPTPGPVVPVVAAVSLTASTATVDAAGSEEVTLVAVVKDAGNNAVVGAPVTFTSSSGTVSSGTRLTDSKGEVTEKLSVRGDATLREITITAGSGTVRSSTVRVNVVAAPAAAPKLLLTATSSTLASAGAPGTGVTVRALVLDVNNAVVKNSPVSFSADTGALSTRTATTDDNGIANVTLTTAANPATRIINVTAKTAGAPDTSVKINVVGNKLVINAPPTVTAGNSSDLTVVLTDSAGSPLADKPVTVTTVRNPVSIKNGLPSVTDGTGKLVLSYLGTTAGADTITVASMGESASTAITAVSTNFSVAVIDNATARTAQTVANTGSCNLVMVRDFDGTAGRTGKTTISISRGTVYSEESCTTPLTGEATVTSGLAFAYVKATSPGVATLTATSTATGSTVQGVVEFVSPLVSTAQISVQTSPAVIGANVSGSTSEQSVLRAVVLDKATLGNPVKNARVTFSIISDPSGGTLSQPSEVLTASDGSATVTYIAGPTTTATDGVVIEARIVSNITNATSTTRLTVGKRSLFITAGTGNKIEIPSSSTYRVDYTVFVVDAAGNPVNDVLVTASLRPRNYYKGTRVFVGTSWATPMDVKCANEDLDNNGVLSVSEDAAPNGNGNGRLDPGTPVNITSNVRTSVNGTAVVSITYPKDRAQWLDADFTIRGQVIGSEASYVGYTILPGAAEDFNNKGSSPPGYDSPFGTANRCSLPD